MQAGGDSVAALDPQGTAGGAHVLGQVSGVACSLFSLSVYRKPGPGPGAWGGGHFSAPWHTLLSDSVDRDLGFLPTSISGPSSACTKSQAEAMAGLEHKCSSFNLGHIVIYFSYTFHILRPPHTPSGIDSLGLQGAGGSPRNQVPQIITKMAVSKLHPRSVAEQPRLQGEESESQRSIGTHGRCQLLVQGFPCSGEQKCRAWLPSPLLPRPSWPWPSALLPAAALDCQWWVDLPSSGHDRHLGSEP